LISSSCASDGDRPAHGELVDHDAREVRHSRGEEDRLGADAHDVHPFGERRHQLAIQAMLGLQLRGAGRLEWLLCEGGARAEPATLLIVGQLRPVRRQGEGAPPLRKSLPGDEVLDQSVEAFCSEAKRRADLLARCAGTQGRRAMCLCADTFHVRRERFERIA